jgi:hypothetical protein
MRLVSEYGDEEPVDAAMNELMDDMVNYCERSRVGKVFVIDKTFPMYDEECRCCGEARMRVPWRDG